MVSKEQTSFLTALGAQKHEWTNTRLGSLHTYNDCYEKKLFVLGTHYFNQKT